MIQQKADDFALLPSPKPLPMDDSTTTTVSSATEDYFTFKKAVVVLPVPQLRPAESKLQRQPLLKSGRGACVLIGAVVVVLVALAIIIPVGVVKARGGTG